MENLYRRLAYCLLLAALVAAPPGCTGDPQVVGPGGEGVPVRIYTRVPGGTVTPAGADFPDSRIGTIDVLSFDEDGLLLYRAAATAVDALGRYFEIVLTKSMSPQRLVVLANLRSETDAFPLVPGATTLAEVRQGLVFGFTHLADLEDPEPDADKIFGQERLLPMWGERESVLLLDDSEDIGTVYLLRSLARVTVQVKLDDDPGQKDFELVHVVVYNTPAHGRAIPDAENLEDGFDNEKYFIQATSPSMPASTTYSKAYYTVPAPKADIINTIFIGERPNSSAGTDDSDPWLVIAGKYNGEEPTWYRIPFRDQKGEYRDILRNHDYIFTITEVTGPGSGNEEEPDGDNVVIGLDIRPWDDGLDADVGINGPYTLTVDEVDITLPWQGGTFDLGIDTDYPTWTAVLSISKEEADAGVPMDEKWGEWYTLTSTSGTKDDKTISFEYSTNWIEDREAYLHITAGRFTTVVKINQPQEHISKYFATSNIVVKPDGTLWFATTEEENAIVPANAQGLHFRFGSLIGLNYDARPNYILFQPYHVVFSPIEFTAPAEWSYKDVPFYTGFNGAADEFTEAYPESTGTLGYNIAEGKGDICRYISDQKWVQGRWSIPTSTEMQLLDDGSSFQEAVTGPWHGGQVITNTSGWWGNGTINLGRWLGSKPTTNKTAPESGTIFFPASGQRTADGQMDTHGIYGCYWSATSWSERFRYFLLVYEEGVIPDNMYVNEYGFSVRCIRETYELP